MPFQVTPTRPGTHRSARRSGERLGEKDWLLTVVDGSLFAIISCAPYLLGGRHDVGRLVYAALIASATSAWAVRQRLQATGSWTRNGATWLFGAAVLLLLLQLAPLPASWITTLSPRTAELLPAWTQNGQPGYFGPWSTLSLTPVETRLSLMLLLCYGLLFATVAQRVQSDRDIRRLVGWVGASAGCMALFGLVQWAASNGKFLWIYEHPSRSTDLRLSGAFANRNHFAHFLVLGVPALLACMLNSRLRQKPARATPNRDLRAVCAQFASSGEARLAGLAIAAVAAVLLSCSRGGAVALATALGVSMPIFWKAGVLQTRQFLALLAVCLGVGVGVSAIGFDRITQRLATLAAGSLDAVDEAAGRRKIWAANVEAIRSGGWFGSGAGSHREIYRTYMSDPPQKEFTHAESGYLQVVTENGVAGGVLLTLALALCCVWSHAALRGQLTPRQLTVRGACAAALAASAVHSMFDFVWYLPACFCPTLIFAACLMRAGQLQATQQRHWVPRWKLADCVPREFAATAVALIALLPVVQLVGPARSSLSWDAYQRIARADRELKTQILTAATGADRSTDDALRAREAMLASMVRHLKRAVRLRPEFPAAHRHLATRLSQLFELRQSQSPNPMPVSQIRDAALASGFSSGDDLQAWLARAFSENAVLMYQALRHAQFAVSRSPLQGDAYVRLADLCFLQGQSYETVDALLAQAVRVRPFDADMFVDVGKQYIGRGMPEAAIEAWSHAFQLSGPHRITIARHMAGNWPMTNFLATFEPQWDTLPEVWRAARATMTPEDAQALFQYATKQAEQEEKLASREEAAQNWRTLASMQSEAGQLEPSLSSLRQAVSLDDSNYAGRRALARTLSVLERFDEARVHLHWCLARRPMDSIVNAELKRPVQQRIASLARTESSANGFAAERMTSAQRSTAEADRLSSGPVGVKHE